MKNTLLFGCLISILVFIACSSNKYNELLGTWEKVNQPISEPKINIGGSKSRPIEVLIHFEKKKVRVKQGSNNYDAKYFCDKGILTLGNRDYKLIKLNSDSLVLQDTDGIFPQIHRYFKTEKSISK